MGGKDKTVTSGSLSPRHGASSGCLQVWRVAANISSRGQPTRGGTPAWGLGEILTTPHRKKLIMLRNIARWAGHAERVGERRGAYRALVGKPDGRRPLKRPRRRWEDNIKMDLRETGWRGHRLY